MYSGIHKIQIHEYSNLHLYKYRALTFNKYSLIPIYNCDSTESAAYIKCNYYDQYNQKMVQLTPLKHTLVKQNFQIRAESNAFRYLGPNAARLIAVNCTYIPMA